MRLSKISIVSGQQNFNDTPKKAVLLLEGLYLMPGDVTLTTGQAKDIYSKSNLTKLQLLYWVGQNLRPTVPLFNTVLTFNLDGAVNVPLFRQAFDSVVAKSDALRTVVREVGGVPRRLVLNASNHSIEFLDFSSEPDPHAVWESWLAERYKRPLNVTECPFDTVLAKLGSEQYVWYLNQHHLITDAASSFLLYKYVVAFYDQLCQENQANHLVLPAFEAYFEFERAYQNSPRFQKAAVYWQRKMAVDVEPARFYGRSPRKVGHKMQRISYELDRERTRQLKESVKQKGVFNITAELGLFNILLTLFFVQLHHMSGNRRLAAMAPFHNRPNLTFQKTIGLLMELCPLRIEIDENETFLSLIKKVGRELQQTFLHYQYGSAVALQNNVYDIMFNFHRRPALTFADKPVQQTLIHPGVGSDSFAMHVHDFEDTGAFVFFFDFHEDVFTVEQREKTIAAFSGLVDAFLTHVDQPLSELELPYPAMTEAASSHGMAAKDVTAVANSGQPESPPYIAPRDALEQQLADVWAEVLGVANVGIKDDFFDLGGSSWLAVRLFSQLQTITGRNLPLSTLLQAPTVEQLAEILRRGEDRNAWTSLVPVRTDGNKPTFFCVHGVTGDILWLKDLATLLDDEQPFYGLQARGLDGEQKPFKRIEEMAAYYAQEIRSVQPQGPYFLGGYCMGGNIAYEIARRLQNEGEVVPILVVMDPPPAELTERAPFSGRFLVDFLQNSPYWLREFMRLGSGEIAARVRRKGRLAARALWQKMMHQATEDAVNATDVIDQANELPPYRQKLIETHLAALTSYTPQKYDGRIVIFEARSRPLFNPGNPSAEWRRFAGGPLSIRTVPGSHSSMLQPPHVALLAREIQGCLDEANK